MAPGPLRCIVSGEGGKVLLAAAKLGGAEAAVGFGADEVLLGQPEELGHRVHVHVCRLDQRPVAEVLDQQGPGQPVCVACRVL